MDARASLGAPSTASGPKARYREMRPGDAPFILNSWLHSLRKHSPMDSRLYWEVQPEVCKRLLGRGLVLLAVDPDDTDNTFAYLVCQDSPDALVLHYVYTKQAFRGFHIASSLIALAESISQKPLQHTHETPKGCHLAWRFGSTYQPRQAE